MAIRVLHSKFIGPGEILRRAQELGSFGLVFLVKVSRVLDAYPEPSSLPALGPLAEINGGPVPGQAGEISGTPVRALETQNLHVVLEAGIHGCDIQYRSGVFKEIGGHSAIVPGQPG
jgi:hypothetical protein